MVVIAGGSGYVPRLSPESTEVASITLDVSTPLKAITEPVVSVNELPSPDISTLPSGVAPITLYHPPIDGRCEPPPAKAVNNAVYPEVTTAGVAPLYRGATTVAITTSPSCNPRPERLTVTLPPSLANEVVTDPTSVMAINL